jgi:hypothetical protein
LFSNGPSRGIYSLVSVLTIQHARDGEKTNTYGLGQSVLAGNMYLEKGLLKQPPYLFQVAGNAYEQRIYRTFIPNSKKRKLPEWVKNDKTGDTWGKPLFKDFQLDIKNEPAWKIAGYDEFEASFQNNSFSAKIYLNIGEYDAYLEFPINHSNVKSDIRMWQIETGPVLFPVITKDCNSFEYLPSFVHFNDLEKLDVFYDYPYGIRSVNMYKKGIIESFPCAIKLFSK